MFERIIDGLWCYKDTCNVYVVKDGDRGIAIDFASGDFLRELPDIGVAKLEHVFLTHHHADQCFGLQGLDDRDFDVHASESERKFLDPEEQSDKNFDRFGKGCPSSYSVLPGGINGINFDIAGFHTFFWGEHRLRFIPTSGHVQGGTSVVMDKFGRQIVFSGDAIYGDGKTWGPFDLEWDHWTGTGALAAWESAIRLKNIHIDLLCPSHGPLVENPNSAFAKLAERLMGFYEVKGSISPREKDDYLEVERLKCGAKKISEHLYQFGANAYLLISEKGEGMVFDFWRDMEDLENLLNEIGSLDITACMVSHYHQDHSGGIPELFQKFKTKAVLHEKIAEPLRDVYEMKVPFLPSKPINADITLKGEGTWDWNEYKIQYRHWPGQTWWHALFSTETDGNNVAFAGDSFQPASLWNGTGGFCAYNRSKFQKGFAESAQAIIDLKPDIVAAGHGAFYRYNPAKFAKIIEWAGKAERATLKLCPNSDLDQDYYDIPAINGSSDPKVGQFFWG